MDRLIAIQPCPTCRYAVKEKTAGRAGGWLCKRYPPQPLVVPTSDGLGGVRPGVQAFHPAMGPNDGCGEGLPTVKVAGESEPIPDREVEGAPV